MFNNVVSFLRNVFLKTREFKDEDEARSASVLRDIILLLWAFPLFVLPVLAIASPVNIPSLIAPEVILLVLQVLLTTLFRAGQFRWASVILIIGNFGITIFVGYQAGGAFTSSLVASLSIVLVAGLLLGSRGAAATLWGLIATQTLLAVAGVAGWIAVPKTPSNPTIDFLVLFTSYALVTIFFLIATSGLGKALESSRAKEREIQALSQNLDRRLQEGTAELNRRSAQLESAALVARAAAEIRDLKELLENVVQQITDRFNFYHAGIFLADVNSQYVVLQAASSEGGKKMIERGHRLEIGRQGIVGFAAYQKRPRIAQDVGVDAVFFNNPDLPETHSEVALPLVVQNQLIGILDIQSQERNAFSDADIHTLQTMADQIALAIENTRLIDQSHAAIQELQLLTSENTLRVWRERLGRQSIGYAYSSLGVQPLSNVRPADGEKGEHVIKFPIALRGQQIGVLSLKRKSRDSGWTEGEQEMASKIATQIALAIENARLLEDSQTRASRERMIGDVSTRITSSINIENILRTTVQELGLMVPDSEVVVQLQGEPNGSK